MAFMEDSSRALELTEARLGARARREVRNKLTTGLKNPRRKAKR